MLLIALTHVRIKQRARVIIYYSIQSILEILSRTPSHTSLGSRLTNTYLRNIIIAKSFLPTLAHVYTSIYPITLSSLNSCQPYFTDTIPIHSVLLSSLSFLHELYFTDSLLIYLTILLSLNSCQCYFTDTLLIYPITLFSLSFLHELLYNFQFLTIKSYQQFINKVINMSTISYICLYLFIYLFYYLFILFIIIILYYIIPLTSKSYLRIFSIFDILYVYPKYIYYISI